MAVIDSALVGILGMLSQWVARFNGLMTDSSGSPSLLQYVVNVMTSLLGLSLVAAVFVSLTRSSFGGGGGEWTYSGPTKQRGSGRMYRSPQYGPNKPVYGTKKNPLPFKKRRWKLPWNVTGLNVNGKATWKTKDWKPTNLFKAMYKNGIVPGIIGWSKTRKGVMEREKSRAGTLDESPKAPAEKVAEGEQLDSATEAALDKAIESHESSGGGGQ